MVLHQNERIKEKITRIRKTLVAEKKKFGCFDDSRGPRYLPPELYIKIGDYSGGQTYFRWFNKNFPDDCGFPDFLFEWTIILYMNGKLKEAEAKALETYCANTYLFDRFFDLSSIVIEKYEGSNTEQQDYCAHLKYSCRDDYLSEFSMWLRHLLESEKFIRLSSRFIELRKQLLNEKDVAARRVLLEQEQRLYDTKEKDNE